MNRFDYVKPQSIEDTIRTLASTPSAKIIAGGTNLVDLMKYDVVAPELVVDINDLDLKDVSQDADGGYRIGALVTNSRIAYHPAVRQDVPLLASAILAGASPQLRNAATTAGNLLQRTRCSYFYDPSTRCNKREPGSGCDAIGGLTRMHAILGASAHCIAVHPSDMCVALAALDARVEVAGPNGTRDIPFADFHRLPGDRPELDTTLASDEIIVAVRLPPSRFGAHHTYVKLRDRHSYAFALVSAAVGLEIADGVIKTAAVAMGGVAHKPWRDISAEQILIGKAPGIDSFQAFAQAFLASAEGQGDNDFKIPLARRLLVRALNQAAAGTPQDQSDKSIN